MQLYRLAGAVLTAGALVAAMSCSDSSTGNSGTVSV